MGVSWLGALQAACELRCFPEGFFARLKSPFDGEVVGLCQTYVQKRVVSKRIQAMLKKPNGSFEGISGAEGPHVPRLVVALEHSRIANRRLATRALGQTLVLVRAEFHLQRVRYGPRHLLLDVEYVVERAGIALGPEIP